ncbi:hypothetical protein Tco_1368743 [Tanacetum coccineum]
MQGWFSLLTITTALLPLREEFEVLIGKTASGSDCSDHLSVSNGLLEAEPELEVEAALLFHEFSDKTHLVLEELERELVLLWWKTGEAKFGLQPSEVTSDECGVEEFILLGNNGLAFVIDELLDCSRLIFRHSRGILSRKLHPQRKMVIQQQDSEELVVVVDVVVVDDELESECACTKMEI